MKTRLQEMAKELAVSERVHFSPPLEGEAKWTAYRDADIFVLPSQNENFGNTAAEAVAMGIPVVVTEQCGIAPLLKDVAGLIVRHDEREVREAILRILEDGELREKLKNGGTVAVANLGWEEPIQQLEKIYCKLAEPAAS